MEADVEQLDETMLEVRVRWSLVDDICGEMARHQPHDARTKKGPKEAKDTDSRMVGGGSDEVVYGWMREYMQIENVL